LVVRPGGLSPHIGPLGRQVPGSALARILRTTDAKQIGLMYFVTSFFFFFLAGRFMALRMRGELGWPGMQFLSPGTIMFASSWSRCSCSSLARCAEPVSSSPRRGP
jgi:hypothetical protein